MRDLLRRWACLAMTLSAVGVVWVAAKHPPQPETLYITTDGKLCDRPPPGAPWSGRSTYAEDVYFADAEASSQPHSNPHAPQTPVAAAAR